MRTYRTYAHTYRPGRRGVIKTKPMKLDSNRVVDTMHGILIGAVVLIIALVVAVPHG
jgi:hypothetical protein